jgi:16S rRNA G527 N7-methylase RsmG
MTFAKGEDLLWRAFRTQHQVLDLGSGAGFPGLVLASASLASFTLVESRRKRASFLAVAAAEMDLMNVVVKVGRVEPARPSSRRLDEEGEVLPRGRFDLVTARGYALAPTFYCAAASALRTGGVAILYANSEQNLALPDAAKYGLHEFRALQYAIPRGGHPVGRILGLWRRH